MMWRNGENPGRVPMIETLEPRLLLSADFLWASGDAAAVGPVAADGGAVVNWADFDPSDGLAAGGAGDIEIVAGDGDELRGRLTLPGLWLESVNVDGTDYTRLILPGWSGGGRVGQADLPVIRSVLEIPTGAAVTWDLIDASVASVGDGYLVYPSQPDQVESAKTEPDFAFDASYYAAAAIESDWVGVSDAAVVRGTSFVTVDIHPVRYDPITGAIAVITELDFTLTVDAPAGPSTVDIDRLASPLTASTLSGMVADYAAPEDGPGSGAEYLIITADAFYEEVQPLAAWKHVKGFPTYVATLSEVGTTPAAIDSYIKNAYDNWPIAPRYVLLVGDYDDVPANVLTDSEQKTYLSDNPYACTDGGDYFPDLTLGRLPVHTEAETTTVVDKILRYDRTPDPGEWYDDALIAAFLQGGPWAKRFFMETAMHVYQYLRDEQGMEMHDALTTDTLSYPLYYYRPDTPSWYPQRMSVVSRYEPFASSPTSPFPTPGWISDMFVSSHTAGDRISDAINDGVGLVQHRDHGSETAWIDPRFDVNDINVLANGVMTPVVFSTNCLTGAFDTPGGDCFAEALLKHPAGGAVGVLAATRTSFSGYNDLLTHGMFTSFWADYNPGYTSSIYPYSMRPAEAMNFGKYFMYVAEGAGETSQIEFNEFHWFGDPEMLLRTATPAELTVTHPASITLGPADLTVQVTTSSGPVSGARVCISRSGSTDYWVGLTDAAGAVGFENLAASEIGAYDIVVTAQDAAPYEGQIDAFFGPSGLLDEPIDSSATNVDLGYVDIEWLDTSGAGVDTSTIDVTDIFVSGVTITSVSEVDPGVWRYRYAGSLTTGVVEVAIVADSVQDFAGDWNVGRTPTFVYDTEPVAGALVAPLAGSVTYDDLGRVDIRWTDLGAAGVDASSLDAGDIVISGVTITAAPTHLGGDVWRYGYTGSLPTGEVTVSLIDGAVLDRAGNGVVGRSMQFTYSPLEIATGPTLPPAMVSEPYSTVLTAQGGLAPYTWSIVESEYAESDPGQASIGGGSPMDWRDDDESWELTLPWAFSFYGVEYTSVWVCSNGFLDFGDSDPEHDNSTGDLRANIRIAPLWDDLVTDGVGENIYVDTSDPDAVRIRWDGHTFDDDDPVDFMVTLRRNGDIRFDYGAVHQGLSPTIGLSAGDGYRYLLAGRDGAATIPTGQASLFTKLAALPDGFTLDPTTGVLSGYGAVSPGLYEFSVRVTDSRTSPRSATKEFLLELTDIPPLTVELPAGAIEGDGTIAGVVHLPSAAAEDTIVALSSSNSDEARIPVATVTVPAGETSAPFIVEIVDDDLWDQTRIVSIGASSAAYRDGAADLAVADNERPAFTFFVPGSATEGAGALVAAGLVFANMTAAQDVTMTLDASDPVLVNVRAPITIAAGESWASFDIVVGDNHLIESDRPVAIDVTGAGDTPAWDCVPGVITIIDNDRTLVVTVDPPQVWENAGMLADIGRVTIGGILPTDLLVPLTSSDPAVAAPAAGVTIPAGQTDATFALTIFDDLDVDGWQTVAIAADTSTFTGLLADIATTAADVDIFDDELSRFDIDPVASPQTADVPFAARIRARNIDDQIILPFAGCGTLTVPALGMDLPDACFVGGVWTGPVTISAVADDVFLNIEHGGVAGDSDPFDVRWGALDHFEWSIIDSPRNAGSPFAATITATDAHGWTVESFGGDVTLTGLDADATAGNVVSVLSFVGYSDIDQEYLRTLEAISTHFTDYVETSTTTTNAAALASELIGKDVFLIIEQENATAAQMESLGDAWADVLTSFVSEGGTVIACSHAKDENILLAHSGLLEATRIDDVASAEVRATGPHPITDGTAASFEAEWIATYHTSGADVLLETVTGGEAVVMINHVGDGRVVMIGTDYFVIGTDMDRIIANAVAMAQAPPITVTPATVSIVGGQWTGEITVSQEAPAMRIHADYDDGAADGLSNEFQVAAAMPTVLGRYVFYNHSVLDGADPAANGADDLAIDPAKHALLPGQTPSPANITGYALGINGLMVDLYDTPEAVSLSLDDFDFHVGDPEDPDGWIDAPIPAAFTVRTGDGADGGNRVTIIWADGAVIDRWLRVTVGANAATGLTQEDVFYFGNLVGDADGNASVDLNDFFALKSNMGSSASGLSGGDFNLDGVVTLEDFVILKSRFGASLDPIAIESPPTVSLFSAPVATEASFHRARRSHAIRLAGTGRRGSRRASVANKVSAGLGDPWSFLPDHIRRAIAIQARMRHI